MALNDEEEAALRAELDGAKRALKDANKEAQGHRLNADRANDAAQAAAADRDAVKADLTAQMDALRTEMTGKATAAETAAAQARTESSQRVLRAELRAAAVAAGMRDPDDLGALDVSAASLTDDGKVKLPDGFFAKMKEAKPYLFGAGVVTTASTSPAPAARPGAVKKFDEMNDAERAAWKRENGIR